MQIAFNEILEYMAVISMPQIFEGYINKNTFQEINVYTITNNDINIGKKYFTKLLFFGIF